MYSPTLGRWMEPDPANYIDGSDLYQTEDGNPVGRLDPTGLFTSFGPDAMHPSITRDGLKNSGLPPSMVEDVVNGNIGQDIGYLFNQPPFSKPFNHGDNGPANIRVTIDKMYERWRGILSKRSNCPDCKAVHAMLVDFGMILHAIQDLYSHSNYVELMDQAADGTSIPGTIPLWNMSQRENNVPLLPDGLTSGNYKHPLEGGPPPPSPTHAEMAKDDPSFPASKVQNGTGTTMFELAVDLATRATEQAWNELRSALMGSPAWDMLQKCISEEKASPQPSTQPSLRNKR